MAKKIDINVHHITRVEGHGNIVLKADSGKIEKLEWQVPEAPRFFEAMVRGADYRDIQTVVSRVCGICSISHSFAAIKAIEDALGIEVSAQTAKLRKLAHYSEQMQSHTLHVGYLAAPDLLGVKSVVPLVDSRFELVQAIIKLHRIANNWSDLIAGRTTHPTTFRPGGFSRVPTKKQLADLKAVFVDCVPDLKFVAAVVLDLAAKIPDFKRETEYVALVEPGVYTFYAGNVGSTDSAITVPPQQFESVVNEYVVSQSTAKWAKWHRESYMCGALARFNLNQQYLHPLAGEVAAMFGLRGKLTNPYLNTIVQLVEIVECVEAAIELIDDLVSTGIQEEPLAPITRFGTGAGAVEAPRGILFHRYTFDGQGICQSANMSIPTNQNHANIQHDMEALLPQIIDKTEDEIRLALEMLVRAYDPCISCSTHYLDVSFV